MRPCALCLGSLKETAVPLFVVLQSKDTLIAGFPSNMPTSNTQGIRRLPVTTLAYFCFRPEVLHMEGGSPVSAVSFHNSSTFHDASS